MASVAVSCSDGLPEFDEELYQASRTVDLSLGTRGDLLDEQETGGAPDGIISFRFLYRSEGAKGEPTAVTGLAYRPEGPPPRRGFPTIVYAHGTTGIADPCAPSYSPSSVALVKDLVAAGYAVVQTDYVGLGTPGAHPYMHGPSEGRAVLDSLVAAREIDELSLAPDQAALWGYSQGGHAVLAASQMVPEMQALGIVGVVDAAGPARAQWITEGLRRGAGPRYSFTVLAQVSWASVFGLDLRAVAPQSLVDRAAAIADESAASCPNTDQLAAEIPEAERAGTPMSTVPGWAEALAAVELPVGPSAAPVFLQYGTSDELVPFGEGLRAREIFCATGTPVTMNAQDGGTHITAVDPRPPLEWLAARFRGEPATTSC